MIHPLILISVFIVCTVLGYFIIRNVPSLLHTPLMSGMNALSGVTIVGAIAATGIALCAFTWSIVCTIPLTGIPGLIVKGLVAAAASTVPIFILFHNDAKQLLAKVTRANTPLPQDGTKSK